jgi:hypothetical protein
LTRTGSTRFDGDTWDQASSVGLTATMDAAARAVASRAPDSLVSDQFAAPLVAAVGVDFFGSLASGELDPTDLDEDAAKGIRRFGDAMAIRTRFFDEFFLDATRAGVRQAVILASGPDSRAYRLPWRSEPSEPSGTSVFEVDQPQVIDFTTTTLAGLLYFDDRTDARTYLTGHGRQTASASTTELLAQHGLPPIDDVDDIDAPFGQVNYLSAELKTGTELK